jgi:hypothetical protein
MIRLIRVASLVSMWLWASTPSLAAIMTFDPLLFVPEGTEYSTYTENGITLFAVDGPPKHFHANGGRAAVFADGSPQRITYHDGKPFSLLSLSAEIFRRPGSSVQFLSSTGAVATYEFRDVSNSNLITFGSGFYDIVYVDLIVSTNGGIVLDNIQVVPEPASVALAAGAGLFLSRRTRNKWTKRV